MKIPVTTALHLRCIEADLRDYLMNPVEYRVDHIENIHVLLLEVMRTLNVKLIPKEGEIE